MALPGSAGALLTVIHALGMRYPDTCSPSSDLQHPCFTWPLVPRVCSVRRKVSSLQFSFDFPMAQGPHCLWMPAYPTDQHPLEQDLDSCSITIHVILGFLGNPEM